MITESTGPDVPRALRWTLPVIAGLLLATAGDGPDFGHYADWAAAALRGDIFQLRGNVLSPGHVPFSLAAPGTGLLFAAAKAVLFPVPFGLAAMLAGWTAALLFWCCSLLVLDRVSGGDRWLTLFGAGALFVGTHAGLYSHSYATEVFANALIAALWALALVRERHGLLDALVAGALAGLLLIVRAHVVLYAAPALWIVIQWRIPRIIAAGIPLALSLGEYVIVNHWMTGSLLRAPYVYGGAGFTSVDLWHPEFAAVLAHPLHGLLAYHPLYAIAFLAVVAGACRPGPRRWLWIATAAAAASHVWVQAGWYIWWLGGSTFGMRGMAPAALPLVAGLVAFIAREARARPALATAWMRITLLACAWSFPLLIAGNTTFTGWPALLREQLPAVITMIALAAWWTYQSFVRRVTITTERECQSGAALLLAAVIGYLLGELAQMPALPMRLAEGVAGAALVFAAAMVISRGRLRAPVMLGVAAVLVLATFTLQAALFGRLTLRTEQLRSQNAPPPRTFPYVGASPVDELRVTYAEYAGVPGFEDKKAAFRRFLAWQRLDSTPMAPDDRDRAARVVAALQADPALADLLLEATADAGVVRITGHDMTDAQESRAKALAGAVPGVSGVTIATN